MKKTLFITTLLLSAGAMFTSCNKDVENPDMQAQPEETAQVTRAYGDKTPLIEVYYEINDTNPLNALSYEMNGKKFIDLVQLFASNIQKDANGDPCIFFNDKLAPVMAAKATYIEPLQNAGIKVILNVLGDHKGIGISNLTDDQIEKFAAILTYIVKEYDLGVVCEEEPFRKLVNQGMIQGRSNFVYRIVGTNKFVSLGLKDQYQTQALYVDVNIVRNDILDLDAFRAWMPEYKDAEFILEDGRYVCGWAIEKMSKSFYNVVNPDYIVDNYGADTLRMYEMFLGPLEQSKPWDTNGIDGVYKFLRRFWRLFYDRDGKLAVTDEKATEKELRTLHKTIKKVSEDIENFSFNTSVAAFMICLNELGECNKREVLEPLTVLLAPFAPHIAEELWETLGHTTSVCTASYPAYDEKHLAQSAFEYPVSVNGKLRFKKEYATSMTPAQIQADVVTQPEAQKWLEGKAPKKVIVVPGKIINIVI